MVIYLSRWTRFRFSLFNNRSFFEVSARAHYRFAFSETALLYKMCKARWGLHTWARSYSLDEYVAMSAFGTRSVSLEQYLDKSKSIGAFRRSKGIVRTLDGEGLALALGRPRRQSLFRSPSKSQSLSVIQMDPGDLCEFSIYTSQETLSRWHWPVHRGSLGHTPKPVNEGALGTANANARGNHPCTSATAGAAQELSTNETRKSNHRKCEWDPDPNKQKQPPQVRLGSRPKQPKATTASASGIQNQTTKSNHRKS